jgi:hypothetical protein
MERGGIGGKERWRAMKSEGRGSVMGRENKSGDVLVNIFAP